MDKRNRSSNSILFNKLNEIEKNQKLIINKLNVLCKQFNKYFISDDLELPENNKTEKIKQNPNLQVIKELQNRFTKIIIDMEIFIFKNSIKYYPIEKYNMTKEEFRLYENFYTLFCSSFIDVSNRLLTEIQNCEHNFGFIDKDLYASIIDLLKNHVLPYISYTYPNGYQLKKQIENSNDLTKIIEYIQSKLFTKVSFRHHIETIPCLNGERLNKHKKSLYDTYIDTITNRYNKAVENMINYLRIYSFNKLIVHNSIYNNILSFKHNKNFNKIFEEFSIYVRQFINSAKDILNFNKLEQNFNIITNKINLAINDLYDYMPKAYLSELGNCRLGDVLCDIDVFKSFNEKVISILMGGR